MSDRGKEAKESRTLHRTGAEDKAKKEIKKEDLKVFMMPSHTLPDKEIVMFYPSDFEQRGGDNDVKDWDLVL